MLVMKKVIAYRSAHSVIQQIAHLILLLSRIDDSSGFDASLESIETTLLSKEVLRRDSAMNNP